MSDIVERLRDIDPTPPLSFHADLRREAADEIERLRAALREIREIAATSSYDADWRQVYYVTKEALRDE